MQVSKWGNSLAVRLPSSMVKAMNLKEGDEIEIVPVLSGMGENSARKFEAAKRLTREEALEGLRELRGTMPADYKFDRDEANAR